MVERSIGLALAVVLAACLPGLARAQQVGEPLPAWSEGYLEIHHINTGRGDAAFFILPDGTTMLVDAGAMTRPPGGPRETAPRPDDSRTPGEWIARYVRHRLGGRAEPRLDYLLVTHFHSDHMGGVARGATPAPEGGFLMSGVTEVGARLPVGTVIDRAWPDYAWPAPLDGEDVANYRRFLAWHLEREGARVERLEVGRGDQITLVHAPAAYPEFEVRNVAANGVVWTGVGEAARSHFPPLETLGDDLPTENMASIVLRLSYGAFDYFTGGDLLGVPPAGAPEWHDVETPVAKAVGPVEVNAANHHGHFDAQNAFFIATLRPRVHIIQSWVVNHPAPSTLARMLSTRLYPGPRDVFATNVTETGRTFIGGSADRIRSPQGHVVVRVPPGGKTFDVLVLDDRDEHYRVRAAFGPYACD